MVKRVDCGAGLLVVARGKDPPVVVIHLWLRGSHNGLGDGQVDGVLETLKVQKGVAAGGPWAS